MTRQDRDRLRKIVVDHRINVAAMDALIVLIDDVSDEAYRRGQLNERENSR